MVEVAAVEGLEINRDKRRLRTVVTYRMDEIRIIETQTGSFEFEIVEELVYLRTPLILKCDEIKEINSIMKANKSLGSVRKIQNL